MRRFFRVQSSTNLNPPVFPHYYITSEITEEEFEHAAEVDELDKVAYRCFDTEELMSALRCPDYTCVYVYEDKEKFDADFAFFMNFFENPNPSAGTK